MSQKDDCKSELKEIKKRNQPNEEIGWSAIKITADCTLHRFILKNHYDGDLSVSEESFCDPRMSVYVEGGGFPKLDLQAEFDAKVLEGYNFVGAVKVAASEVLELGKDRWQFLHDPFPYTDKKKGVVPQHPNHAQIVCVKEFEDGELMCGLAEWTIPPNGN